MTQTVNIPADLSMFTYSTRYMSKARIGICGAGGSGKTLTALLMASFFASKLPARADGLPNIAVIDTENGRARKHFGTPGVLPFLVAEIGRNENGVISLDEYHRAVKQAERAKIAVIIVDSLSHVWDAILDKKERLDDAPNANNFSNWNKIKPDYQALVNSIVLSPAHFIGCMRSKMEYEQTKNAQNRTVIVPVGMKPEVRDGLPYEFDLLLQMDADHSAMPVKSCIPGIDSGMVFERPGYEFAAQIFAWLETGDAPPMNKREFFNAMAEFGFETEDAAREAIRKLGLATYAAQHKDNPMLYELLLEQIKKAIANATKTAEKPAETPKKTKRDAIIMNGSDKAAAPAPAEPPAEEPDEGANLAAMAIAAATNGQTETLFN